MNAVLLKRALLTLVFGSFLVAQAFAQSASQEFPTAVQSNEISGTIKARDIGDARLTTYYYAFNGEQGDLFINLVTRNFAGDIDVFTANGLRPLTKVVVYADYSEAETGRAIYLRKPEKLLLRVQGRTPNDDEATFRLKFAGSFVAMRSEDVPVGSEMPKVVAENRGGIRVNSVGTILPPPPKPVEREEEKAKTEIVVDDYPAGQPSPITGEKTSVSSEVSRRASVVVTDTTKAEEKPTATASRPGRAGSRRRNPARNEPAKKDEARSSAEPDAETDTPVDEKPAASESPSFRTLANRRRSNPPKKAAEPKPDPLDAINLVIQFKDGTTLEKRMSEVAKFSADKGVLTLNLKNGSVSRYPIVDVAKVTIE